MSLDKQHGEYIAECNCGETFSTGHGEFEAARAAMKAEGWTVRKIASPLKGGKPAKPEWIDLCRGCSRAPDPRQTSMF